MGKKLYEALGLEDGASPEEIKAAGRRAVKRTHPDAGGNAEEFHQVTRALTVLRDPAKRAKYDETGDAGDTHPEGALEATAQNILAGAFTAILQQPIDPKRFDVVAQMRTMIKAQQAAATKQMADQEAYIAKLSEMKRRVKRTKRGRNVLLQMVENQIGGAQEGLVRARFQMQVAARAFEMVQEYVYECDQVQHARPFGAGGSSHMASAIDALFRG